MENKMQELNLDQMEAISGGAVGPVFRCQQCGAHFQDVSLFAEHMAQNHPRDAAGGTGSGSSGGPILPPQR